MATTTKGIVVRRARTDDYQAVLDINRNVYDGADYIHYYYKDLVTDPDFTFYVCEVDGEVAAFEGVCLLDDNNTLMTRAARVKDKFQGRGLLGFMRRQIYEDFKDVEGEKRIRNCCTNMVRLVNSATFRSHNRTLGEKILKAYEPLSEQIKLPAPYCLSVPDVREMKLEEMGTIFQNQKLRDFLFPLGFISINSWFFEPRVTNFKHMKKLFPYISISSCLDCCIKQFSQESSNDPRGLDSISTGVEVAQDHNQENTESSDKTGASGAVAHQQKEESSSEDKKPEGLMIISGHYFSPSMLVYVMDIYGKPRDDHKEEDIRNVVYHSIRHAASLLEQHDQKVPLHIGFSMGDEMDLFHNVTEPLGFTEGALTDFFKKHYFFEQNFEQLLMH